MSKDELRPAVEVWRQAHQALYWLPKGTIGEQGAAAIIEADRAEVARLTEQRVVEGIVAWLRGPVFGADCDWNVGRADDFAGLIEAGEWKQ